MTLSLDMIGIATSNIAASVAFYERLGLDVPDTSAGEDHVETVWSGMRVAWDDIEMLKGFLGEWPEAHGQRIEMAFKCSSAAEVDETYTRVVAGGHKSVREPWDAFWGQRYAILEDPDGNHVSLFA